MTRTTPRHPRAFSLIEAVLASIIVATMFAAAMAAAGAAARDRTVQREIRTSNLLARTLLAEVIQQRYADHDANTIAPYPGISTTSRSDWTHINDYDGLRETAITDRSGNPIPNSTGYAWRCNVNYMPVASPAPATSSSGGLLGGIIGAVGGAVSTIVDTTLNNATDTGLKKIVITVKAPSGKTTVLTALRSSGGAVDRVSTGFNSFASFTLTVGSDSQPITSGVPLLNTPPSP